MDGSEAEGDLVIASIDRQQQIAEFSKLFSVETTSLLSPTH